LVGHQPPLDDSIAVIVGADNDFYDLNYEHQNRYEIHDRPPFIPENFFR
jgi:hypothetical protein